MNKLWEYYNIRAPFFLSDCSFENLQRVGMEVGDDICYHVDEEDFKCKDCEHSKPVTAWYPPVTPLLLLQLCILVGSVPHVEDLNNIGKDVIEHIISKGNEESIKDFLQEYVLEFKGM